MKKSALRLIHGMKRPTCFYSTTGIFGTSPLQPAIQDKMQRLNIRNIESASAIVKQVPDESACQTLIVEGSDQHRGWFQSMLLTHAAVQEALCKRKFIGTPAVKRTEEFAKLPFEAAVTHGFLVDASVSIKLLILVDVLVCVCVFVWP